MGTGSFTDAIQASLPLYVVVASTRGQMIGDRQHVGSLGENFRGDFLKFGVEAVVGSLRGEAGHFGQLLRSAYGLNIFVENFFGGGGRVGGSRKNFHGDRDPGSAEARTARPDSG